MSSSIHARLDEETEAIREQLKKLEGWTDSEIVRARVVADDFHDEVGALVVLLTPFGVILSEIENQVGFAISLRPQPNGQRSKQDHA